MKGSDLRQYLIKKRVTISEFADHLGISVQALYSMLNAADVKSSLCQKVAAYLNVSIAEVYGEEPKPSISDELTRSVLESAMAQNDKLIAVIEKMTNKHIDEFV